MNLKSVLVAAEGSFETHHWLLPETAEIIYGGLASLLVFGALYKFALPMFKTSLAERTERSPAVIARCEAPCALDAGVCAATPALHPQLLETLRWRA